MNHRRDGLLTPEQIERISPPAERMAEGPVVVIECVENIPCNPCASACPKSAITIEGDINDTPSVDYAQCNGCTLCISACPGLAIFVVDASGDKTGTVAMPYEYRPLPDVGETVTAVDRAGEDLCDAKVVRVLASKALDRTPVVTLELPKDMVMVARHFKRKED